MFIPSAEQQAILEAVEAGGRAIAIQALAGTGKTTMLEQIAKALPITKPNGKDYTALFCAFNASIVGELKERLSGTSFQAKTFHSIGKGALSANSGFRALQKATVDGDKYHQIVNAWSKETPHLRDAIQNSDNAGVKTADPKDLLKDSVKAGVLLAHFVRVTLTPPADTVAVSNLFDDYRLGDDLFGDENIQAAIVTALPGWLREGELKAKAGLIDFDDMIYLPVVWNTRVWANDF